MPNANMVDNEKAKADNNRGCGDMYNTPNNVKKIPGNIIFRNTITQLRH